MPKEEVLKDIKDRLAKAAQAEKNGDTFASAIHYKELVSLLKNAGQSKDMKKYTQKMIKMNKKAMEGFKKFEFSENILQEEVDKFIKPFFNEADEFKLIEMIGKHSGFSIRRSAVEGMPTTVAGQICSLSAFDEEGNLTKGGSNNDNHDFVRNYGISQGVEKVFLQILFQRLMLSDKLTPQNISSFFQKKLELNKNIIVLIQQGIEKFFEQDYISSLHILIPQFDRLFIGISKMLGIDTTVLNRSPKGTQEISTQSIFLSEAFLKKEDAREKWGDDFCEQINFVFCNPLGYQIRHKFAHGNITVDDCNFQNAALVLWFFITTFARLDKQEK